MRRDAIYRDFPMIYESHSLDDTRQLAAVIASWARPGDVIALLGNLGAGKTHFVQAFVEALGPGEVPVQSPTFTLIHEYDSRIPVCHFDAYRLRDADEFLELGADELIGADNICLIEWADRVQDVLPRDLLTIHFENTGQTTRQITLEATASRSRQFIHDIQQTLQGTFHEERPTDAQ